MTEFPASSTHLHQVLIISINFGETVDLAFNSDFGTVPLGSGIENELMLHNSISISHRSSSLASLAPLSLASLCLSLAFFPLIPQHWTLSSYTYPGIPLVHTYTTRSSVSLIHSSYSVTNYVSFSSFHQYAIRFIINWLFTTGLFSILSGWQKLYSCLHIISLRWPRMRNNVHIHTTKQF